MGLFSTTLAITTAGIGALATGWAKWQSRQRSEHSYTTVLLSVAGNSVRSAATPMHPPVATLAAGLGIQPQDIRWHLIDQQRHLAHSALHRLLNHAPGLVIGIPTTSAARLPSAASACGLIASSWTDPVGLTTGQQPQEQAPLAHPLPGWILGTSPAGTAVSLHPVLGSTVRVLGSPAATDALLETLPWPQEFVQRQPTPAAPQHIADTDPYPASAFAPIRLIIQDPADDQALHQGKSYPIATIDLTPLSTGNYASLTYHSVSSPGAHKDQQQQDVIVHFRPVATPGQPRTATPVDADQLDQPQTSPPAKELDPLEDAANPPTLAAVHPQ